MTLTKSQAVKLINSLFNAIPDIYQGFGLMRDNMYFKELDAEKQHRRNRPSVKGFTATDAARYFTVSHLYQGATASYTIEDMIDIRHEALLGCAYARRYAEELKEWMELVRTSEFHLVDYAELMKG
jgi:hypothetical protein